MKITAEDNRTKIRRKNVAKRPNPQDLKTNSNYMHEALPPRVISKKTTGFGSEVSVMAGAVSSITVALVRRGVSGDVVREVDRGRTRPDTIDFYWLALIDNSRTK